MKISNGRLACAFLCAGVVATLCALGTIYFEGPLLQYFPTDIAAIRDIVQFNQRLHEQRLHENRVREERVQNPTKAAIANTSVFTKPSTAARPLDVKLDMISTEIISSLTPSRKFVSNLTSSGKVIFNLTSSGKFVSNLISNGKVISNLTSSGKIVSNFTSSGKVISNLTSSGKVISNLTSSGKIVSNFTSSGKVISNLTSSGKVESSFTSSGPPVVGPTVAPGRTSTKANTPNVSLATPGPPRVLPNGVERLICVQLVGGLGNQLFQYASGLGLAYFMRRTPVFLTQYEKLDGVLNTSIRHPTKQEHYEERCKQAKGIREEYCCVFSEKLTMLSFAYDWYVRTYLQSWKYWIHHEDKVKEKIMFSVKIQEQVSTILKTLRGLYNDSELIGVHVRKGDMANLAHKRQGYPTATPEYIQKALKYFVTIFPKAVFVVASDSMTWCKTYFPSWYKLHYLENNTAVVDFATLSSLDHIAISFGTYSWWAGYLNKGLTVYMKDFLVNGSYLARQFNPEGRDYIYPGWIPL